MTHNTLVQDKTQRLTRRSQHLNSFKKDLADLLKKYGTTKGGKASLSVDDYSCPPTIVVYLPGNWDDDGNELCPAVEATLNTFRELEWDDL